MAYFWCWDSLGLKNVPRLIYATRRKLQIHKHPFSLPACVRIVAACLVSRCSAANARIPLSWRATFVTRFMGEFHSCPRYPSAIFLSLSLSLSLFFFLSTRRFRGKSDRPKRERVGHQVLKAALADINYWPKIKVSTGAWYTGASVTIDSRCDDTKASTSRRRGKLNIHAARKMSLCYFTKETRCQETIILGQFLLHPTRFLSKLDVPAPVAGGPRRRISEIRLRTDSSSDPPPRVSFIIEFSWRQSRCLLVHASENNRDATPRMSRCVDIEFAA